MSEWNPDDPPEEGAGGTMVAVPKLGGAPGAPRPLSFGSMSMPQPVAPQQQSPEAGGTMVGIGRVQIGGAPRPPQVPEAGGTMVGIGRVQIGGAPPPSPAVPEAGGTMVGLGRVHLPGGAPPSPAVPEVGGTMVGMGRVQLPGAMPQAMPEAGGTMVSMPVAQGPRFASAMPGVPTGAPEAGGTMVGIGRVQLPGAMPPPGPALEAGGTMVGIGRVQLPGAMPQAMPEAGGTMVGIPLAGASFAAPQAAPPEVGGTMVGIPIAGASFAPPKPSGPPPAYEITGHLGGGELGQVFRATHRESGQEVALRIVRPDIAAVPGAVEALRDVASLAQGAVHTHLGRIFDLDETASPTLVLEYVPGKLLASLMQERGPAPAPAVIDLGVRLCSALAAAHGAGLAHGRVHSGNVVLEAKSGRWVLVDMAHGYCMQGLEPLHDLYALGALLYQMATGRDPFETDPIADPRAHVAKLPAGLSALLMRTLAPDPALWFGSAIELAQALARAKSMP